MAAMIPLFRRIAGVAILCAIISLLTSFASSARPFVFMGEQIQVDDRFGSMLDPRSPAPTTSSAAPRQSFKLHFWIEFSLNNLSSLLQNYNVYVKFKKLLANGDALVIHIPDEMPAAYAGEFANIIHRMFYGNRVFLYASSAKISMMFNSNFWKQAPHPPDARVLGITKDLRQNIDGVFIDHETASYCHAQRASPNVPPARQEIEALKCADGFPTYPKTDVGPGFEWSAQELRTLSDQIKHEGFKAGILPGGTPLLGSARWDYGRLFTLSGAELMIVQTQQYCSPAISHDPSLATIHRAAGALGSQLSQHPHSPDAVAAQISFNGMARVSVERALDCVQQLQNSGLKNIFLLSGTIPVLTEFLLFVER